MIYYNNMPKITKETMLFILIFLAGLIIGRAVSFFDILIDYILIIFAAGILFLIGGEKFLLFASIFFIAFPWDRIGPYGVSSGAIFYLTFFIISIFCKKPQSIKDSIPHWAEFPIAVIIISLGLSLFNLRYIHKGSTEILMYLAGLMALSAIYSFLKNNKENLKIVVISLIATALLASFIGISQYFTGTTYWNARGFNRIDSTFLHPSYLAGCIVLILPFVVAIFLYEKKLRNKFFIFLASIPLIIALLLTYMRGGWVSFVVSAAVITIIKKRLKGVYFILIAIAIFLGALTIIPESFREPILRKILYSGSDIYSFTTGRSEYWELGLNAVREHPILGYGPQKHFEIFKTFANAHNFYLGYWMDWGFCSLLALLVIIFRVMAGSLGAALKDNSFKGMVALGVFGSMIAFLVHGMVEYFFLQLKYVALFWIIIAIGLSTEGEKRVFK